MHQLSALEGDSLHTKQYKAMVQLWFCLKHHDVFVMQAVLRVRREKCEDCKLSVKMWKLIHRRGHKRCCVVASLLRSVFRLIFQKYIYYTLVMFVGYCFKEHVSMTVLKFEKCHRLEQTIIETNDNVNTITLDNYDYYYYYYYDGTVNRTTHWETQTTYKNIHI